METLYEYLLKNYKPNEPIFLADLQIEGMSRANLRQWSLLLAEKNDFQIRVTTSSRKSVGI